MLDSSALTLGSASPQEWRRISEISNAIRKIESSRNRIATQADIALGVGLNQSEYRDCILHLSRFVTPFLQPVGNHKVILLDCGTRESLGCGVPEREVVRLMSEALLTIPEEEQTILSLYFKEKLNAAELAIVMNMDEASASFLLARAIFRLRSYVDSAWPTGRRVN
jgi:RNA polymerase sigma factor FliA